MFTTTNTESIVGRKLVSLAQRRAAWLRAAALALALWFTGVAVATAMLEPTREVMVLAWGRSNAVRAIVATQASIVNAEAVGVIARGERAGFVAELYGAGALLVLPARFGGCGARRELKLAAVD